MTVETASYIDELNATLPNSADGAERETTTFV